jgi:hypothetical protein
MRTVEEPIYTLKVPPAVDTDASDKDASAHSVANYEQWDQIIDAYLVEWGRDPSSLDDGEIIPPSVDTINKACQLAIHYRDNGAPPPLRVVPDADGGIAFERSDGSVFQSLYVLEDGEFELLTFRDCKLIDRQRWT